jgi:hypothetical protein
MLNVEMCAARQSKLEKAEIWSLSDEAGVQYEV